jgi:hypothetical protein
MDDTSLDNLAWLTRWYATECNGDWEHQSSIRITTIDNPGWRVTINLYGTLLEDVPFSPIRFNVDVPNGDPTQRWHMCWVDECCFTGAGGALDLDVILGIFREWAEAKTPEDNEG